MKRWLGYCIFVLVLGVSSHSVAQATPQAVLSWNPSPETDVIGYRVYQTVQPGFFGPPKVLLDLVTTVQIFLPSTRCTVTYYFAVTAINDRDQESALSQPVHKTIQGTQYWIGACKH